MNIEKLIEFMSIAEKLKCNLRHSWTSSNRQESVAEHSWRLCLLAFSFKNELKDVDIDRVMLMCLLHDLGEALTGDIPSFEKGRNDEELERDAVTKILFSTDFGLREELTSVFNEIEEGLTVEAKVFRVLDKLEVVMQHNEAPIGSWIELEYDLNLTYGEKEAEEFEVLRKFRQKLKEISLRKIELKLK